MNTGTKGRLIPMVRELPLTESVDRLFERISEGGRRPHMLFFESADRVPYYGRMSVIVADPCMKIKARGREYTLEALDETGSDFLNSLVIELEAFGPCSLEGEVLRGTLPPCARASDEMARLRAITPFSVLRAVLSHLVPEAMPAHLFCGLFGALTYDFIETFENLPPPRADTLDEDDFVFYYANNLILADHERKKLIITASTLVFDEREGVKAFARATGRIEALEKRLLKNSLPAGERESELPVVTEECSREEYMAMVEQMKKHIIEGDIFQSVPSRTVMVKGSTPPWAIYRKLRSINPSPYMFYINDGKGVLLGASPEMLLRVTIGEKRTVETRPIAGTRPRGIVSGLIDEELDSRYEASLKTDFKELAEHSMLIDLARNDIARVSRAGTRTVTDPYRTEKYSHVQHLVSTVKGELKEDLDAFHAYLAVMNAGTLTGAPKLKAMELLRRCEKSKRGFYGGAAGYFSINGDMDSCIIIRSMRVIEGCAYLRAGAGIVYDSIPEAEYDETERKLAAVRRAIEEARLDG
jgi:anthranilate synthase component I